MAKYRKKPIVLEAFQMTDERLKDKSDWPDWLHKALAKDDSEIGSVFYAINGTVRLIFIHTLEGVMDVGMDCWIIQGVEGELYSCDPGIFAKLYEAVQDG